MRQERERKQPPPTWRRLVREVWDQIKDDLFFVVIATGAALVKAMGTTIDSGWTGLRFTMGRAGKELAPGFHPLIPFVQKVRRIPTRSRTLDLPAQRVATFQGLVYLVDANLVYRVTDVRKALIQIDQLEKGMIQMLGMGVQDVLRGMDRERILAGDGLDDALAADLAVRLAPWGVHVEHAGFPTITPTRMSLRITQLGAVVDQRVRSHAWLAEQDVPRRRALGLIGTRVVHRPHRELLRRRHRQRARVRRIHAQLVQRKWTAVQIKRAETLLRARLALRSRSRGH